MFFDSLHDLLRVVVVGALAYFALLTVLRISGKRSLAKLNIFGFVVTVAFGSTLATVLLSKDVSLAEGILAFAMLAGLQWIFAQASRKWQPFGKIVRSSPRLMLYRGCPIDSALDAERVTKGELKQAARMAGRANLGDVYAIVLETDGSFSVIPEHGEGELTAMSDVVGFDEAARSA